MIEKIRWLVCLCLWAMLWPVVIANGAVENSLIEDRLLSPLMEMQYYTIPFISLANLSCQPPRNFLIFSVPQRVQGRQMLSQLMGRVWNKATFRTSGQGHELQAGTAQHRPRWTWVLSVHDCGSSVLSISQTGVQLQYFYICSYDFISMFMRNALVQTLGESSRLGHNLDSLCKVTIFLKVCSSCMGI